MNTPTTTPISICPMRREDIPAGLRLCRESGWNQTARDWEMFLTLSPQGCRVAVKEGRVVGTAATVRYEGRFSWIGMVFVDPAERGQGIGTRLMNEALGELKDMPSVRLDATPAGREVYRKLGFVDECQLSRMETVVPAGIRTSPGNPARPMTAEDIPLVAALDREVFGADRRALLAWMLEGAPAYARVIEAQGHIVGYSFGRHGFTFEHLGPVVAPDPQVAQHLVPACLQGRDGQRFILDAPQHEPDWLSWLTSLGFHEQRVLTRMFYRGNPYPGHPHRQFAILGPEFG